MEVTTPIHKTAHPRHRKSLVASNNIVSSPLRRAVISSPVVSLERTDDQSERQNRRSIVAIQKRVSNIAPATASPIVEITRLFGEKELNQHITTCTKLFTENKISTKNAWELRIIDILRQITHTPTGNVLQVASISLDISAKVYGIRVDDVHSSGLKLANSVAKMGGKEKANDDEENIDDGDQQGVRRKTQKKRRLAGSKKGTIDREGKTLFAPIQKLDPVAFSTRENVDVSENDNLFTIKLPMHPVGHCFILLNKEKYWIDGPDKSVEAATIDKRELEIPNVTTFALCPPLNDFVVNEWDPEEHTRFESEKTVNGQNDVVLDEQGLPIAELDGSIHDIFENDAGATDDVSDSEENQKHEFQAQLFGAIDHIVDAVPEESRVPTEYGFNTLLRTTNGKIIDKIWAGPSHWKVKFIRRPSARYSGTVIQQHKVKSTKKRVKEVERFSLDCYETDQDISFEGEALRRPRPSVSLDKITLPPTTFTLCHHRKTLEALMTKPDVKSVRKANVAPPDSDCEVQVYNYDNADDSLYCSQHASDDVQNDGEVFSQSYEEVHAVAGQENFFNENLVNAPETVPKSHMHYALQAKKMDMKKLKAACWKFLTRKDDDRLMEDKEVIPSKFSDMYKQLPSMLSKDMGKDLSCPLAFVALLHLCNENNLQLTQHPDYKDFDIKKAIC